MPTVGIDHIAMPTANAERLMQFYKELGFTINDEAEWRAGTANIFSIQIGDSKINVHPEGYTASLRGPRRARLHRHLFRLGWRRRGMPKNVGRFRSGGDPRAWSPQGSSPRGTPAGG